MTLHRAGHRVRAHGAGYRAGRGSAKPLAIVAIGDLITSTILTLFVLPPISHLLLKDGISIMLRAIPATSTNLARN